MTSGLRLLLALTSFWPMRTSRSTGAPHAGAVEGGEAEADAWTEQLRAFPRMTPVRDVDPR